MNRAKELLKIITYLGMNKGEDKIEMLWFETHDGEGHTLYRHRDDSPKVGHWFDLDTYVLMNFRDIEITKLSEIKRLYFYEVPVKRFGLDHVAMDKWEYYIEELSLPEGVRSFSVINPPDTNLGVLHIPQSLEHLECHNDIRIPQFEERIKNGNLRKVDIVDKERSRI